MKHRELEWCCVDGTRMFACEWLPQYEPSIKAVVGLVHGMGEHMGRYNHVAEMLTREGYAVLGFDQRGHGRTEGKRGHTPNYEALLEGIDLMLNEAEQRYPDLPRFLYGHSMGGNVTLNYLLRRKPDLAGAVVTGPWLKLAFKPPSVEAVVGRLMEMVFPTFTSRRPMVADHLTSDPEMIKRYTNDKLGHGQITAKFFFSVQKAGLWALDHASELTVPLLLMHGGDDQVTSLKASKLFADKAGHLVTWREWPGFKHELHNELNREDVFSAVREWLKVNVN